jgi:hypothetical protein
MSRTSRDIKDTHKQKDEKEKDPTIVINHLQQSD